MTHRFCSTCGGRLNVRPVDGRPRGVCMRCGAISYENPLPVAAALVLSPQREVLLVKRKDEPNKGMWCLPIGFAETGETIAQAALRELEEEAGIGGRIVRLIDVDSSSSTMYGDLLIVTFEIEKIDGAERAGDDAEDVAYFPVHDLPPLAFSSNEKAVRVCAELHGDEWAIRDSFLSLEAEADEGMLSDYLVGFLAERAQYVSRLWLARVRSNPTTPSYRHLEAEALLGRASEVLSQLGVWLQRSGETANVIDQQVKDFYRDLGRERRLQGVPLHELLSSLMLLKRQMWDVARTGGLWASPVEMYRVLELQSRFVTFFDKAMYQTTRGYLGEE